MKLGRLKSVGLREYWKTEPEFTRWLAESGNIELLSDEVGIEIRNPRTEASVGRFAVDILAEDAFDLMTSIRGQQPFLGWLKRASSSNAFLQRIGLNELVNQQLREKANSLPPLNM